jgi:predicted nucleic acid-binding protein
MTMHYLDPSAWAKRHFAEAGSDRVRHLLRTRSPIACCQLGLVEMSATVARRSSEVVAAGGSVQSMLENVRQDFDLFNVIEVDDGITAAAATLAVKHRLRALDAVHLACSMSLTDVDTVVMVSSDGELVAAALREGLETVDPATA